MKITLKQLKYKCVEVNKALRGTPYGVAIERMWATALTSSWPWFRASLAGRRTICLLAAPRRPMFSLTAWWLVLAFARPLW